MRPDSLSINQLRVQGYLIRPSRDDEAYGCTVVLSPGQFWFTRWPRSDEPLPSPRQWAESLEMAAHLETGEFRLIAAGTFDEDAPFPFHLLTPARKDELAQAYAEHEFHSLEARRALEKFNRLVVPQ